MRRACNNLDIDRVAKLKAQGLGNNIIAIRLGVTQGAIFLALKRIEKKLCSQNPSS